MEYIDQRSRTNLVLFANFTATGDVRRQFFHATLTTWFRGTLMVCGRHGNDSGLLFAGKNFTCVHRHRLRKYIVSHSGGISSAAVNGGPTTFPDHHPPRTRRRCRKANAQGCCSHQKEKPVLFDHGIFVCDTLGVEFRPRM